MRLLGGNPDATVRFEDPLAGRVNYLIGRDQSKWVRNAGLFRSIRVINAYDGIDIRMYGNDRLLEYDVIRAAGRTARRLPAASRRRRARFDQPGW